MRKRLIEKLTNKKKGTLGYTLSEMLVVVGIIAIACAIAIPSIIAISGSLRFAQANNYAKSIFLAAQQNLTELRSDGGLGPVQAAAGSSIPLNNGFPDEFRTEYVCTTTGHPAFDLVLPAASIDSDVRDDQIIIEYNPLTGNVYAVFYCSNGKVNLSGEYFAGTLPRDKENRRDLLVGYYDGSGLNSSQIELEQTQAIVEFDNGEEGVIRVMIPMPESFFGEFGQFADGLNVTLDITGDYSISTLAAGEVIVPLTIPLDNDDYKVGLDGRTVILEFPIDSLANRSSFANYASKTQSSEPGVASSGSSLTTLLDETAFTTVTEETANNVTTKKVYKLLPGENITIQANVSYTGEGAEMVRIAPGILSGVNPMFEYLQPSGNGGYILAVANGRNLQNLNAIAPTIAEQVETVVFTSDIYWNDTVAYYNDNYGGGSTYHNTYNGVYDEAPARALPYFVPIHNEDLFGTARFIYPSEGDGGLGSILQGKLEELFESLKEAIFGGYKNPNVPSLTDEMDAVSGIKHATIQGDGHKVYNLNIDSTKYAVPNNVENVGSATQEQLANVGKFYAVGGNQLVDYYFTGLFGYVNTPISGLHVVNPIVKGHDFEDKETVVMGYDSWWDALWGNATPQKAYIYGNPATGALLGAGGYNTLVTNCSTYVDKNARGYMNLVWGPYAYSETGTQNWYGVSGEGAVGGLVGYAKSHRNVTGELTDDEAVLAFSKCFAAVPVSGNMRTSEAKNFGYSNGVGALIGNSQLTNFYNCYASGNVLATGCNVDDTITDLVVGDLIEAIAKLFGHTMDLPYNGRTSWGAGGFVGTSHGTRYTNCFATGNVNASSTSNENLGAGGFVGFMSIDETFAYGNDEKVAQRTVFTDCYAVGMALTNGATYENFSGANGRVAFNLNTSMSYFVGDYFKLYAPYYANHKSAETPNPVPDYESVYIYRDSYFLSNYHVDEDDQENSSNCASPDAYASFEDMVGNHDIGSKWMADEIQEIKNIHLYTATEIIGYETVQGVFGTYEKPVYGDVIHNYDTEYFQEEPNLENIYKNLYDAGYSAYYWNNATATTTHPYSLTEGSRYPFTKLKNMDYYGDWPSKPSDLGLAYYETYLDTGKTHYFFDKNHNDSTVLTLREGANVKVKEDGYVIFSADKADLTVTINGVSDKLTAGAETYTVGKKTYHVFRLSDKLMAVLPADGQFYATVTAKHAATTQNQNPPTYTMYFNSRVAMSHVNPVEDSISAVMPDAAPTTIYIRSARQFKGIATLDDFWGTDYSYIQQLNIDATEYDDWAASTEDNDYKVSPIGTAAQPFNATYSAVYSVEVGVDSQYELSGFQPTDAGFFGVIGESGSVSDLIVECSGAQVTSQTQNSVAVLAGINNGAIDNVTLTITGPVSLTAETNAGLLAGLSTGTVTDCTVTTDDDSVVTISAANAGGLIGSVSGTANKGAEISNTTLNLGAALNVNNSTNAGGYIGYAAYLTLEQPKVTVKAMTTDADYAGGLAGYAENTTITGSADANTKEVTVDSLTAEGYAAAVLGGAKNTTLSGVDSTVKSVTAGVAAGFLGTGENADADNCTVLVTEKLQGQTGAAGVAGTIGSQSVFDHVPVILTRVNIWATNGNAAGYALEIKGEATVMNSSVTLGFKDEQTTAAIDGSQDAAGFACVISGNTGNSHVTGCGAITGGNHAAGYAITVNGAVQNCHVSPAHSDADYLGNANSNLRVSGINAAGFAMTIGENTEISYSYTLCAVRDSGNMASEGDTAGSAETETPVKAAFGFAGTNEGTINRCTANVDITGGYAFVGENNGVVTTCYSWFDDGVKASYDTILEPNGDGKCYSSYFADLDPMRKSDSCVALYDEKGAAARITSSALQNAEIKGFITGYKEYPYGEMEPAEYLYPMLRDHYGNWITPPQYASGYAYYEKYSDGTYKIHLMDLSDNTKTEENAKVVWCDNFKEEGTIEQAGYAQFFNTQTGDHQGTKVAEVKVGDYTYALYAIEDVGCKTYTNTLGASKSVTIDTRYADAMVEGTAFPADYVYQIRTAGQLANVKQMSAASFVQKHSIAADKFEAINNFTGRYNGSDLQLTVATGNTWITTLGTNGFVENVNLTVTGAVTAPIFGTVNGKLELDALNLGSVDQGGALVTNAGGSITSGSVTIGAVSGNVFGTVNGSVTLGDIKIASVSENGSLINLINNASATVTTGTISVGTGEGENFKPGAVNGKIFGNSIGKITVGTSGNEADVITTGAVSGQIFGDVANTTIYGNITTAGNVVSGQIFGDVNENLTVNNDIIVGAVNGKVFGTVAANKTVDVKGLITIDITAPLSGKIFEGVAGTVNLSSDLVLGDIGKDGEVFGDGAQSNIAVNNVTVGKITANTVDGKIFANVNGTVNVNGTITTDAVNGQIFGDSNGTITVGTTGNTENVITTGAVTGQVFGNVGNTTIHGNIAVGQVSGRVFGTVAENKTVAVKGAIKIDTATALNGKIFEGVAGTVNLSSDLVLGDIGKNGEVFGNGANDATDINNVTVGKITAGSVDGMIFAGVSGNVNTGAIDTKAVNGQIFGNSTGTITVGTIGNKTDIITTGAVTGQVFGNVAGTTIHGNITTAGNIVSGKVFGNVNGTVNVNGTITTGEITAAANDKPAGQIFGTVAASKAVTVNGAINTGAVNGQIFGDSNGTIAVGISGNKENVITTGTVTGQVFGNVGNTTIHGNIVVGQVSGQVFGNVGNTTIHGNIVVGQVSGKVFGTVAENKTVAVKGAIKIDTTTALNGKIFEGIAGTVNLSSDLVLGDIGKNGEVFGDGAQSNIAVNNVTVGKITAGSVDGMIFAGVSGNVNTGAIDTKAVNGQIFGDSNGTIAVGTTGNTENVITTGAVTGQVFGNVGNTTIHGNIAVGKVDGKVFGTVAENKTVAVKGAIKIDTTTALNGKIFEGIAGTVNLSSDLVLGGIGANGEVFGDGAQSNIAVNNVTVGKITAGSVDGMIFAGVSGNVNTGAITTGAVNGQIFGDSNGTINVGTTGNTENVITTGAVTGQVFGNVAGTTIHGNITTAGNTVSGKVFGTVNGTVNVNGTITTGAVNGQIFGAVSANVTVTNGISVGNVAGNIFGIISKGTVQPGSITTGDASVAEWLITSVTGGTVQLGSVNVTDTEVPTMIGAISVGTVSGGTVSLGAANTSGNLFASVTNGATLKGFAVNTTGSLGASLIGSNTATVNKVSVNADSATATGGVLVGNNSGVITNSSVNVNTVTGSSRNGNFGVIADQVASGKTATGNTVEVTTLNVTAQAGDVIGGLFGSNAGTISGSTVKATLNVSGAADANTVIGGLVGVNSSSVSIDAQSNVTINYTQPAANTDSATIGGLVGRMDGGSLTDTSGKTSVTGAINLKSTGTTVDSKRSYTIGGAVGKDSGTSGKATYTDVVTNVHVNDNWAVKGGTASHSMPAGKGAVGKFVGYVNNGVFDGCASNNKNGAYMFLGEIVVNTNYLSGTNWYGHTSDKAPATVNGEKNVEAPTYDKYVKLQDGYAYYGYSAKLKDCEFLGTDGKTYYQQYKPTEYFYQGTEEKSFFYTVGNQVGKLNAINHTPTYNDIHEFDALRDYRGVNDNVDIPYYVLSNGVYCKATVTVDRDNKGSFFRPDYEYTYQFKDKGGNLLHTFTVKDVNSAISGGILYTLDVSFNSQATLYIIADSACAKALAIDADGNPTSVDKPTGAFESTDALFASVWDFADGTGLKNAKYTSKYLNLNGSFTASAGSGVSVDGNGLLGNTVSATAIPNFTLKCNSGSYLTFNGTNFSMGNPGSALSIFEVSKTDDFRMKAYFEYKNVNSTFCGAYDVDGNELIIPATTSLDETDLPAESGEAPEGTEVVETTDVTEPPVTE